jgi:hypothetical protein
MTTHYSLLTKERMVTDHDIFAALAQVRKGAVALTCATRTLVRDRPAFGHGAGFRLNRDADPAAA